MGKGEKREIMSGTRSSSFGGICYDASRCAANLFFLQGYNTRESSWAIVGESALQVAWHRGTNAKFSTLSSYGSRTSSKMACGFKNLNIHECAGLGVVVRHCNYGRPQRQPKTKTARQIRALCVLLDSTSSAALSYQPINQRAAAY